MSKLLIDATPLQVIPALAQKIGLNEAIILQQMHYWLNTDHNKNIIRDRPWVYNTYDEWQKQFPFWSVDTIRRTILSLEQQDLIISTKMNEDKFNHRKWYSINYERIHDIEDLQHRSVQVAKINVVSPLSSKKEYSQESSNSEPLRTKKPLPDRLLQNAKIEEGKLPGLGTANCHDHYKEQRLHTEITNTTLSLVSLPKPSNSIPEDISKKERDEIGIKMIKMFSRIVSQGQELLSHPERINRLKHVLHSQLQGKLENWEKVCQNITHSKFLMGEAQTSDFKATLDWVMMKDHAIKIFEGNSYGIGDRNPTSTSAESTGKDREVLLLEFKTSNKHPLWIKAGLLLEEKLGFYTFKSYISELDLLKIEREHIKLLSRDSFVAAWVKKNLESSIKQTLSDILCKKVDYLTITTEPPLEKTLEEKIKPQSCNDKNPLIKGSIRVEKKEEQVIIFSQHDAGAIKTSKFHEADKLIISSFDINKSTFPSLQNPSIQSSTPEKVYAQSSEPPLKPPGT